MRVMGSLTSIAGKRPATAILTILILTGVARPQNRKATALRKSSSNQSRIADDLQASKTELLKATNDYKASLKNLIAIYVTNLTDANAQFAKQKELYAQGIISKRELDQSEAKIREAEARIGESKKRIEEADDLVAESTIPEATKPLDPGRTISTAAYIRYAGAHWSLSDAAKVQNYFQGKFGHQMPISAFGQTATHDRLGFDHRNSVDVALNPDSSEGQALMAYLRGSGVPFMAFRRAIPGSATGAHIHIGYPSHRTSISASAR